MSNHVKTTRDLSPMSSLYLWEILVPTIRNNGKPIRTRCHKVWDRKVRDVTGGLTIMPVAKGQWICPDNQFFLERMIPVRIMCSEQQMLEIAKMTRKFYEQIAVMYYRISDKVIISYD